MYVWFLICFGERDQIANLTLKNYTSSIPLVYKHQSKVYDEFINIETFNILEKKGCFA